MQSQGPIVSAQVSAQNAPGPAGIAAFRVRPSAISLRAALAVLLLVSAARPQAFSDLVQSASPPPSDSDGAFCAVARWGGRLFILRDAACLWTADGGATWKRRGFAGKGPKGPVPALEGGWFTGASGILCLGNRSGALAWRYDPAADTWTEWPAGAGAIAAAGSGERLWAFSADRVLRHTRDAGVTWARVPLPDEVREGTFFDDVQADGDALLLRVRDRSNIQRAAASLDGGATWEWFPAHAHAVLAGGCAHAFPADSVHEARCPGGTRSGKAPFAVPEAAFSDPGGTVFAWSGGRLYAGDGGGSPWRELAGPGELEGWAPRRDLLFSQTGAGLSWFDGMPASTSLRKPAGPIRIRPAEGLVWKGRHYALDGRLRYFPAH